MKKLKASSITPSPLSKRPINQMNHFGELKNIKMKSGFSKESKDSLEKVKNLYLTPQINLRQVDKNKD